MKVIETKVYEFEELSDSAKEVARQWWRNLMDETDYAEYVINDACEILVLLGVEVKTREVKLRNGSTGQDPCIWWSGFSSQGDGASFEGYYKPVENAEAAVKGHAPVDQALHAIARDLDRAYSLTLGQTRCSIRTSGNYCHSGMMDFEFEWLDDPVPADYEAAEKLVVAALRSFADWIYRQLEAEYNYQSSDEAVDERLTGNEYTFTAEGKRFG